MRNLAELAVSVTEFAARNTMTLVPAVPERDLAPEANISPDTVDLQGFLAFARTLGGGVLYLKTRAPSKSLFADQGDGLEDAFGLAGGGSQGFGDASVSCEA